MEKQIPRVIHYFWFGQSEMEELNKKCLASWEKYCPDYEIRRWDESNVDVNECAFTKEAAQAKKWGFVTDYFRLKVLYEQGGFYFDTDVELIKSIEPLRNYQGFIGFETKRTVNDGQGMGAVAGHPMVKEMMQVYEHMHFLNADGSYNLITTPELRTQFLVSKGLKLGGQMQNLEGFTVLPADCFCPKNFATGEIQITGNTYGIHHYQASWHGATGRRLLPWMQKVRRVLGVERGDKVLKWVFDTKDYWKARIRKHD